MSKSIRVLLGILVLSAVPVFGQISSLGPNLSSISPTSVAVGSPDVILKLTGTNFRLNGTTVLWNTTPLATNYVSGSQLAAKIPSSFLTVVTTAKISVRVSTLAGSSISGALPFAVKSTSSTGSDPIQNQPTSNTDSLQNQPTSNTILTMASSLPNGVVAQPYNASLVRGGKPPYALNVLGGMLPAGITFDGATGALVGVPKMAASYGFNVGVKDAGGMTTSRSYSMMVTLASSLGVDQISTPFAITTTALPSGVAGRSYTAAINVSGGVAPYKWQVTSGTLPPGLALSSTTGVVSGTPTATGNFAFAVQVRDSGVGSLVYTYSLAVQSDLAGQAPQ